jgi:microcystin-dependent protein
MAQHDFNIANQSFPSFRTDLNNALSAINTSQSGTSRPSGAVAGTIWLDTTSATTPTLKYYDGADDISLATLDHSANTVNWLDSTVSITGLSTTATGTVLTLTDSVTTSTVNLIIDNQKEIRFRETTANGTNYVALKAPASVSADLTFTLPATDGTSGQALTTNGSGALSFATVVGVLTGSIIMYGSGSIPTGYLECTGQAVSRSTYADLFAVIGTTFGVGDGTTTFNVPDLRDNFPVGVSGTKALATKAGSNTATLATTNLASHSHGVSGSNYTAGQVNTDSVQPRQSAYNFSVNVIDNTGSGTAFNTFPPYIALTFIIKT